MSTLLNKVGTIDPASDPAGTFRTLKYSLNGEKVTVIRSPHDFTKQTAGAAEGVDYLLDDRKIEQSIEDVGADIQRRIIELGAPLDDIVPDPNIRHKGATIDIAKKGGAEIENAIRAGSKVVVVRGAHDAMDLSSLLEVTKGDVGIVIIDTHADIHSPTSSTSKNPHGMWVRALLGEGEGLDEVMNETPKLKPENLIYIGLSQLESAEADYLNANKKIRVFTGYEQNIDAICAALDKLQSRVPVWLDIDEDAMVNAAATMPGGMVTAETLKTVANRIGTNQKTQGMHQVLGVGISEFQPAPEDDAVKVANAEYQADVLKAAVHQALGAGYPENSTDEGSDNTINWKGALRRIKNATALAGALAAGILGGVFIGKTPTEKVEITSNENGTLKRENESKKASEEHEPNFDRKAIFTGVSSTNNFYPFFPSKQEVGWSANTGKVIGAGYGNIIDVLSEKDSVLRRQASMYLQGLEYGPQSAAHALNVLQSIVYGAEMKSEGDQQTKKEIWALMKEILGDKYDGFILAYDKFLPGVDRKEVEKWMKDEGYRA